MKLQNYQNRSIYKWINKIFLVDLQRDVSFYVTLYIMTSKSTQEKPIYSDNITKRVLCSEISSPYITLLISKFYMSLNFFRGCNFIMTNPTRFDSFDIHTVYFPCLSLHDPMFYLPLLPMALTYLWLSGSRHPIMIHQIRPENRLHLLNAAFMVGLACVPLPVIYQLGYSGLMIGHLLIRKT
jgi:hypothetical protein